MKVAKQNLKIEKNHITKSILPMAGKQTHSSAQWVNTYITKTIEN